jgi:integrase
MQRLLRDGAPSRTISATVDDGVVVLHGRGLYPALWRFTWRSSIPATAHRLRHFAGTAWYRVSGHDLLTTAALLRHANVATSQIYVQTDTTRPAEVVDAVTLRVVDARSTAFAR